MMQINFIGVVVAGIIAMVVGYAWYGPVFGKAWMAEIGMSKEKMSAAMKKGMVKSYGLMFVSALVMAFVLANVIAFSANEMGGVSVSNGIQSGFWVWLGFVATVLLGKVLWEGRSWKLYMIDAGYYLVVLLVMGAVLSIIG